MSTAAPKEAPAPGKQNKWDILTPICLPGAGGLGLFPPVDIVCLVAWLQAGTERAFTGKTVDGTPHDSKRKGTYVSAVGGLPLFRSGRSSHLSAAGSGFYD